MRDAFGLIASGQGRMGVDALDELGHGFELKSATKSGVTTGRDVGMHTLRRYRTRYWIICKGVNRRSGFEIDECYFLSPEMMEEWISTIERRLEPDLVLLQRVLSLMEQSNFAEEDINRLDYLVKRGSTLNNPKIQWHYVQSHGMKIEGNPKEALKRLVSQHPLDPAGVAAARSMPIVPDPSPTEKEA